MNERTIHLIGSAFKHHISAEDIKCAVVNWRFDEVMEDDEGKRLLLGFDTHARLLEILYNEVDEQTLRVFHADTCRAEYEKKLGE
jgi:hypothetical protein